MLRKSPNFVSDLFYLTAMFHHFAVHRTILTYMDILREVKEMQKVVEQMKVDRFQWANVSMDSYNQLFTHRLPEQLCMSSF
jgi:hypothetical protein